MRTVRSLAIARWGIACLACVGLWAAPITIPSTGVDLDLNGVDDFYQLTYVPSGPTLASAYVATNQASICPGAGGCWVLHALGNWIAPDDLVDDQVFPPGAYQYRATFDLTGFIPATLVISGQWAADGYGANIVINGKPTGVTTVDPNPGVARNYFELASFTITNDSCAGGCFQPGVNTLVLSVMNGGFETGVLLYATGDAEPIPEPATVILFAAGLTALGSLRLRRA